MIIEHFSIEPPALLCGADPDPRALIVGWAEDPSPYLCANCSDRLRESRWIGHVYRYNLDQPPLSAFDEHATEAPS